MVADQLDKAALSRAIECRDWETFDRIVGNTPEETERMLREGPFVDASEVNRRMEELDGQDEQ